MVRTFLRRTAGVLVVLGIAAVAVLWYIGRPFPEKRLRSVFGPVEALREKFPRVAQPNREALELERLTRALGIRLGGVIRPSPQEPEREWGAGNPSREEAAQEFWVVEDALRDYLRSQIKRLEPAIDPAPEPFRRFLAAHATELWATEGLLLAGEIPLWPVYEERGTRERNLYPTWSSLVHLDRLLLADCLESARTGDREGALRAIQASLRLAESMRLRPEYVSQALALGHARSAAGILRKLDHVPPAIREMLTAPDWFGSFQDSMRFEAWRCTTRMCADAFYEQDRGGRYDPQWRLFTEPLVRRRIRISQARAAYAFPLLQRADPCALADPTALRALLESQAPPDLRQEPLDSHVEHGSRWGRFLLDLEMTSKVWIAKDRRDAAGAWPTSIPGFETARCPGGRFTYESTGSGVRIAYVPPSPLPEDRHALPLEYREGPPSPPAPAP